MYVQVRAQLHPYANMEQGVSAWIGAKLKPHIFRACCAHVSMCGLWVTQLNMAERASAWGFFFECDV